MSTQTELLADLERVLRIMRSAHGSDNHLMRVWDTDVAAVFNAVEAIRAPAQGARSSNGWSYRRSIPEDGFECYFLDHNGVEVGSINGPQSADREALIAALVTTAPAAQCAPQPSGEPVEGDMLIQRAIGRQEGYSQCRQEVLSALDSGVPRQSLPAVSCAAREALEPSRGPDEKRSFESAVRGAWGNPGYGFPQEAGEYVHSEVRTLWKVWQARAALSLPAAGGEASKREAEIIERPSREAIARVIFPNAFLDEKEKSPPVRLWTQAMQDAAFETADAVLALFIAPAVVPDERGAPS
jgi:hypothetical protein